MSELKRCPFCGEQPVIEDLTYRDIGFFIVCENLDCPAPSISVNSDSGTLEDATKNWNTRDKADQLALLDKVRESMLPYFGTYTLGVDYMDEALNKLKQELTK